ncbi:MAG: hypothetical protein E6H02_09660 [Bacillati bacterium ANGP1]|uniref:Uncharacterized protein n=1 Tax=Candidatus Segetimicrobium genomatis TaxID=2569760 RepID=A0A537LM16_9BACT|nr:MAG: hypothetical protein E6H02_09660 [Terrabacteria group bacterium ANGP1]
MSAQPVRRTRNARRSLPVGDAAVRLLLPVILVLAVLGGVVPAWGDGSAPPQIVPGVGIGPVRIGMTGTEAQEALALFEVESHQCTSSAIGAMAVGTMLLPEVGGIGGTPAPLVRAFGDPRRFVLDPGMAVLLWPNGLVARIAASRNYEIITYLAVVAPQTAIPPYAFLTALPPSI